MSYFFVLFFFKNYRQMSYFVLVMEQSWEPEDSEPLVVGDFMGMPVDLKESIDVPPAGEEFKPRYVPEYESEYWKETRPESISLMDEDEKEDEIERLTYRHDLTTVILRRITGHLIRSIRGYHHAAAQLDACENREAICRAQLAAAQEENQRLRGRLRQPRLPHTYFGA